LAEEENTEAEQDEILVEEENTEAKQDETLAEEELTFTTEENSLAANGNIAEGTYGNITWIIDKAGKLTITGTGSVLNYERGGVNYPWPWLEYAKKILSAEVSLTGCKSLSEMFTNCINMEKADLSGLDTSQVTNMSGMFNGCKSLTSLDVSKFNTSQVTNMDSMFNGCSSLPSLDVSKFNTSKVTDMRWMFRNCKNLTSLDVSKFNTSQVTNMDSMFNGCSSLPSLDVSKFDTIQVTSMDSMFAGCSSLPSLNLSSFDTSQVTNMDSMFNGCSSLPSLDVSKFDTSQVTSMDSMFAGCSSLPSLDLSNFDTSQVTNMGSMFSGCESLPSLDVSKFDTSKVTNMVFMFRDCTDLLSLNVSKFNTSRVTDMSGMFDGCGSLTSLNVSSFDTSKVTNMSFMFGCESLPSLNVSSFDTSQVTDMVGMFNGCKSLTSLDLSGFDTGQVTNMGQMFELCLNLPSLDLSKFDTSKVTNMSWMFIGCKSLTSLDLSSFDTSQVTNMSGMFEDCSSLPSLDLSSFDMGKVTEDGSNIFVNNTNLTAIKTPKNLKVPVALDSTWRRSDGTEITELPQNQAYSETITKKEGSAANGNIAEHTYGNITWVIDAAGKLTITGTGDDQTGEWYSWPWREYADQILSAEVSLTGSKDLSGMFIDCNNIERIDLSKLDTSQVTDMSRMFSNCKSLTSLDMSGFDTSQVTDMSYMFSDCFSLPSLDLSKFDTSKVTNMSYMFDGCSSLNNLDVSKFDTSQVTDMSSMFSGCKSLPSLDLSNFDMGKVRDGSKLFTCNTDLTTIKTPKNLKVPVKLYTTWKRADGTEITELPQNQSKSEVITKTDRNIAEGTYRNMTWVIDAAGKLTVTGTWDTWTYERGGWDGWPWQEYAYQILSAEVSLTGCKDLSEMFMYCNNMESIDLSKLDTSQVTNMRYMFYGCESLPSLDVSKFDTSQVTNMYSMFVDCESLPSLDLSNFDTSQVTDMSFMFYDCSSLLRLDLSGFDTSQVTNMYSMFVGCESLPSLDLSNFDTSQVTDMRSMFSECESLTSLNVSGFNTSKVTDMVCMFDGCRSLPSLDVSKFDTSQVTSMIGMFSECESLPSLDVSKFDTSQVTSMGSMFNRCESLTSLDVSKFDTSQVTSMGYMFYGCESLPSLDLSNFDTSQVTSMEGMFMDCPSLVSLDLSKFKTSRVTSMSYMFCGCGSLPSLNVSKFDTSQVTEMREMFLNCKSLPSLDLSSFDTSQVTDMRDMFYGCKNLSSLDLSSFDMGKVIEDGSNIFKKNTNLTTIKTPKNLKVPVALYSTWRRSDGTEITELPQNQAYSETITRVSKPTEQELSRPTFTPAAGMVEKGTKVSITSEEGAKIYYTIDGTNPTTASSLYIEPISIEQDLTIKAIAVKSGYQNSAVASASYQVKDETKEYQAAVMPDANAEIFKFGIVGENGFEAADGIGPYTFLGSQTLAVKITPAENYKVKSVVVKSTTGPVKILKTVTTPSGAGSDIYYELGKFTEAVTIEAKIVLDESKTWGLMFEGENYTAQVFHDTDQSHIAAGSVSGSYGPDKNYLQTTIPAAKVYYKVKFTPSDSYQIDKVSAKIGEKEVELAQVGQMESDGSLTYTFDGPAYKTEGVSDIEKVDISVTTSLILTNQPAYLIFQIDKDAKASFSVEETEDVQKKKEEIGKKTKSETWRVNIGARKLTLKVTRPDTKTGIRVQWPDNTEVQKDQGEADSLEYTYTITGRMLQEKNLLGRESPAVIRIAEIPTRHTVSLEGLELVGEINGDSLEGTTKSYTVRYHDTLELELAPKDNCALVSAEYGKASILDKAEADRTEDEKKEVQTAAAAGGKLSLSIKMEDENIKVKVKGEENIRLAALRIESSTGTKVTQERDGSYFVDAGTTYSLGYVKGVSSAYQPLSKVVIDGQEIKCSETEYKLQVKDDAEGRIKAELYYAADVTTKGEDGKDKVTKEDRLAGTYNLTIRPILTDLAIGNTDKDGSISQLVGTTKTYPLTASAEGQKEAKLNTLVVKPEKSDLFTADIVDGLLIITVANQAEAIGKTETFSIYRSSASKEALKTVNVSVIEPVLKNSPIEAKLSGATDKTLVLNVKAPKGQEQNHEGNIYYKVSFTKGEAAESETASPIDVKGDNSNPKYIRWDGKESQNLTVPVFADVNEKGEAQFGAAWNFDVSVTMVQAEENSGKYTEVSTGMPVEFPAATKKPYYDTQLINLKMKKSGKTIYSGQNNAEIATVMLEKETSVMDLKKVTVDGIVVYGWNEEDGRYEDTGNGILSNVRIENDRRIIADVEKSAPGDSVAGTHTMKIELIEANSSISPEASISFKVVEGIYKLNLSGTPKQVQKEANKAVTIKAQPIYNGGEKTDAPKTKKVNWYIGKNVGGSFTELTPTDRLYGMVTVKNGTVTINKNYTVLGTRSENRFILMAKAADYEGNTTVVKREIEVTDEAVALGSVLIARWNSNTWKYDVVAKNGASVSAEKLVGAKVIVLSSDAPSGQASYDTKYVISRANYSLKSSNKAIAIDSDDDSLDLEKFTKPVKNLKITATALGNTKKTTSVLTLAKVDYAAAEKLGLVFTINENLYNSNPASSQSNIAFAGTPETVIRIEVCQNVEGEWVDIIDGTDYKLKLKGLKSVQKNKTGDIQWLTMSKDSATIEITNSKKETIAAYTLTNTSYNSNKAPSYKTKGSLKTGVTEEQGLVYTLSFGRGEGLASYNGKYVLIQADSKSYYNKNKTTKVKYRAFWNALAQNGALYTWAEIENGEIQLKFKDYILTKGNYKLSFTVGNFDKAGNFLAETKTSNIGVKVAAPKKNNFKPNTAYTMSLIDNASIRFTGTGKNIKKIVVLDVYNDTVEGMNNDFVKYFAKTEEGRGIKVQLAESKLDAAKVDWSSEEMIRNRTGYVDYAVWFTDGTIDTGCSKITINFTEEQARAYTLSQPKVLKSDEEVLVYIDVLGDKQLAEVNAAKVIDNGGLTAEIDDQKTAESGKIALKVKGIEEGTSYNLEFSFHPEASFYAEEKQEGWISASTTLKAEKKTAGKKVAMTENRFVLTDEDYNFETKNYTKRVEYCQNIFANVSQIKSNNGIVKFVPNNDGSFTITVKKAALANSNAFGQMLGTDKKNPLTAGFEFGGGTKSESFNLALKLPEEPVTLEKAVEAVISMRDNLEFTKAAIDAYTEYLERPAKEQKTTTAQEFIEAELENKINALLTRDSGIEPVNLTLAITLPTNVNLSNGSIAKFEITLKSGSNIETIQSDAIRFGEDLSELDIYYRAMAQYIRANAGKYSSEKSVTEEKILEDANKSLNLPANFILSTRNVEIQTATDARRFRYQADWYIRGLKQKDNSDSVNVKFEGTTLDGVPDVMGAFITKIKGLNNNSGIDSPSDDAELRLIISNRTTQDDILNYLKAVAAKLNSDIEVAISDFKLEQATNNPGKISFAVTVKNDKTDNSVYNAALEEDRRKFEIVIPALKGIDVLTNALKTSLGKDADINSYIDPDWNKTQSNLLRKAEEIVGSSPYKAELTVDGSSKMPTTTTPGNISYTISLIPYKTDGEGKETTELDEANKKLIETISNKTLATMPYLQTLESVKTAIEEPEKDADGNVKLMQGITAGISTTREELRDKIQAAIEKNNIILDGSNIHIKVDKLIDPKDGSEVENISYTTPTVNSEGSITIVFALEKRDKDDLVALERTTATFHYDRFAKLPQSFSEAVSAAKGAVTNMDERDIIGTDSIFAVINAVISTKLYQADVTYTPESNNSVEIGVTITELSPAEGQEAQKENFKVKKTVQ